MGVETELLGIKNRYDGKEFRVIEREDGTIAVLAGDTVIVDSGVTPVTATPSELGLVIPGMPGLGSLNGPSLAERFLGLLGSGRKVGIHIYGNSFGQQTYGHIQRLCTASGGRMFAAANGSVGGLRLDQIAANIKSNGFSPLAQVVAIFEGTNDASQGVSNEAHIAGLAECVSLVINSGRIPLVTLASPNDKDYSDTSNGFALREKIFCERNGIPFYDPWARWVDTDGTWVAGASGDGIHPYNVVYNGAGVDMWAAVQAASFPVWLPRRSAGEGLLQSNVLQLTDTNADGLPDGWTALTFTSPTYALSNYAFPARGKKCSATVSQSEIGSFYRELTTGFSVGDTMRISGVAGLSGSTNASMRVFVRAFGTTIEFTAFCTSSDCTDTVFEGDFVVPTGTTKLQLYVRAEANVAGTYSGVLGFGCIDLYNITALSA